METLKKQYSLEAMKSGEIDDNMLDDMILKNWPKGEKIAHKDVKMRTFISQEKGRAQLVSHVYDITYGVVGEEDTLVMLDDSIVRGTTLKESILKILTRVNPAKIVICSTAPQIRYPDCYGIDMSELGKFIAFKATVALHKKAGNNKILQEVYDLCVADIEGPCGDWYFTGDFPTPGGMATVNAAYINWFDNVDGRSYDLPL